MRILDDHGRDTRRGRTGRIFVGTISPFEGYTGGGGKEIIDGLLSTGDVGHLDSAGRLHIDGRDDEMIVSGGENVFPREIEELLLTHAAIADAAAIGIDDEQFGRRLRAFVVVHPGRRLSAEQVQAHVKKNLARCRASGALHRAARPAQTGVVAIKGSRRPGGRRAGDSPTERFIRLSELRRRSRAAPRSCRAARG